MHLFIETHDKNNTQIKLAIFFYQSTFKTLFSLCTLNYKSQL